MSESPTQSYNSFIKTLRAQWLGQQLRRIREQRGLMLKEVAAHLDRDKSALSRYERAEWPIRRADVVALLDLYGFHRAAEREQLIGLAEELWRTDRWTEHYGDLVDASFIAFPWLESRAESICSYHAMVIPGLFQTPEYARRIIRAIEGPNAPASAVRRYVELRMERQHLLDKPDGPKLDTVIDEAALRRAVGGPAVLAPQLARLSELTLRPHVTIRVLPTRVAEHAGLNGSFWLFRMPKPYPEVGYLEHLAGQMYLEMPKAAAFVAAYARIQSAALDPRESARLIASIAEEAHERSTAAGGLAHQHP